MPEEKSDSVRESAARYEGRPGPVRDPKTGRFVAPQGFNQRKASTFQEAAKQSFEKYEKTFKKLAE
ncbi:hypothetical protein C0431_05600 [bacterium]|jgi:hypothetical protein|nr:hypothetical protein [bacterium]